MHGCFHSAIALGYFGIFLAIDRFCFGFFVFGALIFTLVRRSLPSLFVRPIRVAMSWLVRPVALSSITEADEDDDGPSQDIPTQNVYHSHVQLPSMSPFNALPPPQLSMPTQSSPLTYPHIFPAQMLPFPFGMVMAEPVPPSPPASQSLDMLDPHFAPQTYPTVVQQPQTLLGPETLLFGSTNSNFDEVDLDRSRSNFNTVVLPRIDEVLEDVDPNSVVVPSRALVDVAVNTDLTLADILYTSRDDLVGDTIRMASPSRFLSHTLTSSSANGESGSALQDEAMQTTDARERVPGTEATDNAETGGPQTVDSLEAIVVDLTDEIEDSHRNSCSIM